MKALKLKEWLEKFCREHDPQTDVEVLASDTLKAGDPGGVGRVWIEVPLKPYEGGEAVLVLEVI